MGILSNKISRDELKLGLHIYSWRQAYVYAHHGIYVGDDRVIHFTRGAGQETGTGTFLDSIIFSSSIPSRRDHPCPKCGHESNLEGVISTCLECFLSGGDLYAFEYGASIALFLLKPRGGTYTSAPSDPAEHVIHRAEFLLRSGGFGVYDLFDNNCEDFATYCKTGLMVSTRMSVGRSGQAGSLFSAAEAVLPSPLKYLHPILPSPLNNLHHRFKSLTTSFYSVAVVGYGRYCFDRVANDIGFRRDVIKVPVETLAAQHVAVVTEQQGKPGF